ncbi:MAG: alpha/beta fold hydrolase [Pseudanabaena sp. ELA607]
MSTQTPLSDRLRTHLWYWRGWQIRYGVYRPLQSVYTPQPSSPNQAPFLLIHGFGAALDQWRDNFPVLADDVPSYGIDLLGFGGSAKPAIAYTIDLWVAQIYDFWRIYIDVPVVLAGNSIGALVAVIAAARYPQMVQGVVAISLPDIAAIEAMIPPPLRPVQRATKAFLYRLLAQPLFNWLRQPSTLKRALGMVAYTDAQRVDDDLVESFARPARDPDALAAFICLGLSLDLPNYSPNLVQALRVLQQAKIPLLLIWGKKDRAIPPTEGPRLQQYYPAATLIELDGVGHCAHDDAPLIVNQTILTWYQQHWNPNFAE